MSSCGGAVALVFDGVVADPRDESMDELLGRYPEVPNTFCRVM